MKRILIQHKLFLTLLLFLVASIASIYLTELNDHIWSFLIVNNDGRFHMMRIEGLYESLKQGQLFPIVNMSFLGGFGYISNVFYANLWLYPVAIMRLLGFSISSSFITFYIALNFATFLTSFSSFYYASRRYDRSLLFSFVYTLSGYRVFDMVRRFDLGEVLTMVFLPIVILGIYEIFYGDHHKWLILVVGMVAVIYSHALSPILITVFIVYVLIFRFKSLLKQPQRILSLIYAGTVSLILSLAYFLPVIEQLKNTQFKLTNSPLIDVSQSGMNLESLFRWSITNDLYNPNLGTVTLLIAIFVPYTIWKTKNIAVRDFALIGEILLFMTTENFPWKLFVKTPLNMIQFPWRFNMLITVLMAIYLASSDWFWLREGWQKSLIIMAVLGLTISGEQMLIQNHPYEYNTYDAFDKLDDYSIGGGEEYLPKEASLKKLHNAPHIPVIESGNASLNNFVQRGSKVSFSFQNAQKARIDVPVIGYYGYSAKESTGHVSNLSMDLKNNGLATVTVNGSGVVRIDYYATFTQKISRFFSLVSFLLLVIIVIIKRRLKNRVSLM